MSNAIQISAVGYDKITHAALLATAARENMLIDGPKGRAKSMFVRQFFNNFKGNKFEVQLTKHSDPSALFGIPDLDRLRHGGVIEYPGTGLAGCEFAFIDELFDASDVVLRSILDILEEHRFIKGHNPINVPLQSCIATCNYTRTNEVLEAVVDRFAITVKAPELNADQIKNLYENNADNTYETFNVEPHIELTMLHQVRLMADGVVIPTELQGMVQMWASRLDFSPRRHRKLAKLLRTNAALNSRAYVTDEDLCVLEWVLPIGTQSTDSWEQIKQQLAETKRQADVTAQVEMIIQDINDQFAKTKDNFVRLRVLSKGIKTMQNVAGKLTDKDTDIKNRVTEQLKTFFDTRGEIMRSEGLDIGG